MAGLRPEDPLPKWSTHIPGAVVLAVGGSPQFFTTWTAPWTSYVPPPNIVAGFPRAVIHKTAKKKPQCLSLSSRLRNHIPSFYNVPLVTQSISIRCGKEGQVLGDEDHWDHFGSFGSYPNLKIIIIIIMVKLESSGL